MAAGALDYYRSESEELMNSKMDFPPHDAMEEILEPKRLTNRKKFAEKPEDELGNLDSTDILDFQLKELNAYRDAIRRMEKEMESLHEQMRTLHTTNAKLRRQLGTAATTSARTPPGASSSARGFPGAENEMVPVGGGGGELKKRFRKENDFPTADDARLWDKTEMEDRHDLMMKKVDRQARELKEYREKVLKLQNELIQKNEKEKDFLRHSVSSLDNSSKDLEKQVQTRTAKIRGLEEAYRNQEKIIDKMEKLLETRHKGDKDLQEVRNKIIEENKRLRAENQMLTEQNRLMAKSKKEEEEMLHLRQRMDRDAERIRTLEQKLVDNARRWAHEKTDLQTRLEEAEHGFRRTSVLDSASRSFAQPNWSTGADDDRPSPTIDTKFKLNRSSNRLPSIHA